MDQIDILLVEDNNADVLLMKEALKDAHVLNNLHVMEDGEQAIAFLKNDTSLNPQHIIPRLILLDLYMPNRNGMEVLKFVKNSETLQTIPVIVMTSSQEENDIAQAYKLRANSYIIKPIDYEKLTVAIKSIEDFWLTIAKLPPQR